jgi:catechol 2,3-dioxygenase-like lactoylglutathione lyase family enzyme
VRLFHPGVSAGENVAMKIEHVALQVEDPAAMARWYVAHLGCSIARVGDAPAFIHFLRDGAGTSMLELYRNPRVAVPDYRSMDPMLVHVAFVSADPAADRDRLVAAGATIADDLVRTPAGDELVMLRDPWGVALQLAKRVHPMHD